MRISDWSSDVCSSDLLAQSGFSHLERHAAGADVGGHALLHDLHTQGSDAQQGPDKQHHHHDEQRRAMLLPVAWLVDELSGFPWIFWLFRRRLWSSRERVRTWLSVPSVSERTRVVEGK